MERTFCPECMAMREYDVIDRQETYPVRGDDITMPLESLGVPEHALVKIHVVVKAGKDRTGSEIFESDYSYFTYWGFYCAEYGITGTTGNPKLTYYGIDIME